MSALKISFSRKRHHYPDLGDISSDSESEDLPPRKKHKNGGFTFSSILDFPLQLVDRLAQISNWFWDININKFARMALLAGISQRMQHKQKDFKDDSDEEEEEEEEEDDDLEDDEDDDIQEIKENVNQEKLSPLITQFGKSHFSNDSVRSKQQRVAMNGSFSLVSRYNSSKLNGTSTRDLSTRYHGTTNCNLRRKETEKLKRQPLISNPATEIEVILGSEPEVVTLEGDGIEILSESPSSKQKSTSSQKIFRSSVKSSSKNATSVLKQSQPSPVKKSSSSASRSYTANEVVRLQEKAQYKLLLEKYISGPQYHHVSKRSQSDEGIKEDSRIFSNSHFKKQVLEQPIGSFIEKYYTPCRLLSPKAKESSEKKKESPETVTLDDDDDDEEVKIVDMKLPKYKTVFQSKLFTKNWLAELGSHVRAQTEERNKIVQDYERKLEEFKKERLLRRLTVDVSDKAVEPEFPELTPEMEEAVDNAWQTGAGTDVICRTINNNNLLRKDFESLEGLHWLNDTIINSYFDLIVERSKKEGYPSVYAFNTFFYSNLKGKGFSAIRRWTRKIDIFSYDLNFVPMHLSFHWCLAVIDHRSKKISYYDSMGTGEECCLDLLHDYLCLEYKDKKGQILDPSIYVTETMKDIPQQMNGSDCGMFTLKYAEYLARNAEITFDQQHMIYFRRRTVYELLTNQLL